MYVTYDVLIQLGLLLVAIIGLVYKICHKGKKIIRPKPDKLSGLFFAINFINKGYR